MNFRTLKPNEIDVRVGTINEKGATLLLYKDARCDMQLLDEAGVKWKREHQTINNNLFCTVSIWDEDIKEWVTTKIERDLNKKILFDDVRENTRPKYEEIKVPTKTTIIKSFL